MTPEILLLSVAISALAIYAVFGGADFGAGVWELNLAFRASPHEKELLYKAIGPVWEANHVWLIFVMMILWNGFPLAFAAICQLVWLPLLLALIGIVFRGSAYAFRSAVENRQRRRWEVVFALASTAAPFFMGCALGALALSQSSIDPQGQFHGNALTWLSPSSIFFGFFAVGICVFVSAVFLVRESELMGDKQLHEVWRRRAMLLGVILGLFSGAGLVVIGTASPVLWNGLLFRGRLLVGLSIASGVSTILFLHRRWIRLACLFAASAVASVILAWGVARYPYLVIPNLRVDDVKAPDHVLRTINGTLAVGLTIVVPALAWLIILFKSHQHDHQAGDK